MPATQVSCNLWCRSLWRQLQEIGVIPIPVLARMAPPPEPWCAEVGCASDNVGFHPNLLAVLWAALALALDIILVSCAKTISAFERDSILSEKESHEFPLQVSIAQRPLGCHHLELAATVPSSPMATSVSCTLGVSEVDRTFVSVSIFRGPRLLGLRLRLPLGLCLLVGRILRSCCCVQEQTRQSSEIMRAVGGV